MPTRQNKERTLKNFFTLAVSTAFLALAISSHAAETQWMKKNSQDEGVQEAYFATTKEDISCSYVLRKDGSIYIDATDPNWQNKSIVVQKAHIFASGDVSSTIIVIAKRPNEKSENLIQSEGGYWVLGKCAELAKSLPEQARKNFNGIVKQ